MTLQRIEKMVGKKSVMRTLLVGIFVSLVMCACDGRAERDELSLGKAPDFSLQDLNGRIYRLSDLRGRVIILNFFATWCGPCREEIPDFVRLHKRFNAKGLEIIGVSLDMEAGAVLGPFIRQYGIPYPIVLGTREAVLDYGGITGIPTTFVIDEKGAIIDHFVGWRPHHVIEESVRRLLGDVG